MRSVNRTWIRDRFLLFPAGGRKQLFIQQSRQGAVVQENTAMFNILWDHMCSVQPSKRPTVDPSNTVTITEVQTNRGLQNSRESELKAAEMFYCHIKNGTGQHHSLCCAGLRRTPAEPLPVRTAYISDYKEAPETGVVFDIDPPIRTVFSRVNISYTEGQERRSMLYKVPYPPLNISHKIISLNQRAAGEFHNKEGGRQSSRQARDVPLMEEPQEQDTQPEEEIVSNEEETTPQVFFSTTQNVTERVNVSRNQTEEPEPQSYWLNPTEIAPDDRDEEFVNAVVSEYEDSNEPGSAMAVPTEVLVLATRLPPILLELRWLPPRPPTSYDGFNVYIYRDGNSTETATVDENTHEFFTELTEPGTYRVQVTTLSSSGDCEARESSADTGFTFYLSESWRKTFKRGAGWWDSERS
ncbi:hypothetical protein XENOCAPTIV_023618 [Xenoophorus captivus]|uniref:Fibronectin type-III domain-containing protein n=1 Tax=Xenoophorus captivus TaxID=1517983 RepID=A0ABV0RVZ8_9TELE